MTQTDLLRQIRFDFMLCQSVKDCDALVFQYSSVLDENRSLYACARQCRKRLAKIRAEKKKSWSLVIQN